MFLLCLSQKCLCRGKLHIKCICLEISLPSKTVFPQVYMLFNVNVSWRKKKEKNMQPDAESSASKCVNAVESESDKFNYGALLVNLEDALEI